MSDLQPQILLRIGTTDFSLNRDGTLDITGSKDPVDILAALDVFGRPSSGREWWPFLLVHHIQQHVSEFAARNAARQLFKNNSRIANSQNPDFVKWLLEQRLPSAASVEAVCAKKSKIWDADTNRPRKGREATFVVKLLKEGKSSAAIGTALSKVKAKAK